MTDREKLIALQQEATKICGNRNCVVCVYRPKGFNCKYELIADHLLTNGVTMKDRLIEKLVVINKKYNSIRCPSCNTILGASYHYCFQCGQKVIHKLPQLPKEVGE